MKRHLFTILSLAIFFPCLPIFGAEEAPRKDLDYRAIRREARGSEHAKAETPRGTIFYKVKILSIHDSSVTIEHQDGKSVLKYESIPKEWVTKFGLTESGKKRTSKRSTTVETPKFELSGLISISGDTHSGIGFLVKEGEAFYVYTDCAILSGNQKFSMRSETGTTLQYAKLIECAEGSPLARIQIKISGDDVKPMKLAEKDACSKITEHQYLYPLTEDKNIKPSKFSSTKERTIELQRRLRSTPPGTPIILASQSVIGIVLGDMSTKETPTRTSNSSKSKANKTIILRMDMSYRWKKIRLNDYLSARRRISAIKQNTLLLQAMKSCQINNGKIPIPPEAQVLFKKHTKDRNVSDLVKLSQMLAKKNMSPNPKELQRKLNNIIGTAVRNGKKKMGKISPSAFSWYHRRFITDVLAERKSIIQTIEQ